MKLHLTLDYSRVLLAIRKELSILKRRTSSNPPITLPQQETALAHTASNALAHFDPDATPLTLRLENPVPASNSQPLFPPCRCSTRMPTGVCGAHLSGPDRPGYPQRFSAVFRLLHPPC